MKDNIEVKETEKERENFETELDRKVPIGGRILNVVSPLIEIRGGGRGGGRS